MLAPLIPVQGTGAFCDNPTPCPHYGHWWEERSPFMLTMNAMDIVNARPHPFQWSTDLNGHQGWRRWFKWMLPRRMYGDHRDWWAGGLALSYYLYSLPEQDRNIVAHSHAMQVVLYCCAKTQTRINRLVSVGSPYRSDLAKLTQIARPYIGRWLHLYDPDKDTIGQAGQFGDGDLCFHRIHPYADHNCPVPGMGHSKALSGDMTGKWITEGWGKFLRGEHDVQWPWTRGGRPEPRVPLQRRRDIQP
jgi:hypothetical protein